MSSISPFSKVKSVYRNRTYLYHLNRAIRPEFLNQSNLQTSLRESGYYSQYGQDKWVYEQLTNELTNGVFVDIGAHDGISLSNTLFLEQLGWSGLAIEPIPSVYQKLRSNRNCTTINGCISNSRGSVKFWEITGYSQMLSGITEHYHPNHKDRIKREIEQKGGEINEIEVQSYNINDLLKEHDIDHVNYLNIDVEGSEIAILDTIDFSKTRIEIIGIENNYRDSTIYSKLKNSGYKLHSAVGDEFYVKH